MRALFLYFLLSLNFGFLFGQENPTPNPASTDLILNDTNVVVGVLENGLTYYIKQNAKPENRAELRLVVKAGSILEDENQRGLAHFLEHMAFNGTQKFEKQALVKYLESIGTRFGPDLNAYTSFDETVYMLEVPLDKEDEFSKGIEILREWAGNITLAEEEIEKERGVVLEEWRLGRGAQGRIQEKNLAVILAGSKYGDRLPIGTPESIQHFSYEALKQFYADFYRPNLMSVIVVGNFEDTASVVDLIKTEFSDLANPKQEKQREQFEIPLENKQKFSLVTDPELNMAQIGVLYKLPERPNKSKLDFRRALVERLYYSMINSRIAEIAQSSEAPFVFGGVNGGQFIGNLEAVQVIAVMKSDGNLLKALEALATELERVNQYGFTETEFERSKTQVLRIYEYQANEKDKMESKMHASQLINHFLYKIPYPETSLQLALVQELLPTITLDEVNRVGKWLSGLGDKTFLVQGPEDEKFNMPTEQELTSVYEEVKSKNIESYNDEVSDEPLLSTLPQAGTVVEKNHDKEFDITRMKFSNGVEVVVKPTDFQNDEVQFSASSPGGTNYLDIEDYLKVAHTTDIMSGSGLGIFDNNTLKKKLSGKLVSVFPNISSKQEGFAGMATPEDLETLFQLVHLYFTNPRIDTTGVDTFKNRMKAIAEMFPVPELAFRDSLRAAQFVYNPRRLSLFDLRSLDKIDPQQSLTFFKERFADASDFTFYFVGNISVDEIEALSAKYLASLPTLERIEKTPDILYQRKSGQINKTINKGIEPKSETAIVLHGQYDWSRLENTKIDALVTILQTRLRELLREDLGGTYSVSVNKGIQRVGSKYYSINIEFGCNPDRVEELTNAIFDEMENLKENQVDRTYITQVIEEKKRLHEVNLKENRFWLSSIEDADYWGDSLDDVIQEDISYLEVLSPEIIQLAAQKYLNLENLVQVVLLPEKTN